jgi:hypothetical protein
VDGTLVDIARTAKAEARVVFPTPPLVLTMAMTYIGSRLL